MAKEQRLIDANGSYTLNECNEAGYSLGFGGGFIDVYDPKGKYICQFWAGDAPTVVAVEVKCKVGDLVYALWEAPVKLKYIIYCAEVKEIRISMRNCRLTTTYILEPIAYRGHRREYRDEDFGTLVFKNQEDAERKLYPCERCISGTYRSCEGCSYGERRTDTG